jgi:hypothetical protein
MPDQNSNAITFDSTPVSQATPADQLTGASGVTFDSTPVSQATPADQVRPAGQSAQPDHSVFRDLTGSTPDQWDKAAADRKQQFLDHPITQSLKSIGHFLWGGAKAVDELSPASVQRIQQQVKDVRDNYQVYEQARQQGKSIKQALDIAGQASEKNNPLQLFKPPDENSDPTEHAVYDSVRATHGETAGRIAVAFKRVLRGEAESLKEDPDAFAGDLSVKLLPLILSGGISAPEELAAETESGLSAATSAARDAEAAANEARTLSNIKKPGIINKITQPTDAAKDIGAAKGEAAIRKATDVTDLNVPVRRAFGTYSDSLEAEAKPVYKKMDDVLGGRWDANKNALDDVNKALRNNDDTDKLPKLRAQKAELETQREQLQAEAAEKGVSRAEMATANGKWRQARALEDLETGFKPTVDAKDRINLASAIKKFKNFDDLDVAMGGKENAQQLVSRLEDELKHQDAMQQKYVVRQKVAGKFGVGAGLSAGYWTAEQLYHFIKGLINPSPDSNP